MAMKPLLKVKVDELFLKWLSDPDVQTLLKENLHQIKHGEKITLHPSVTHSSSVTVPKISPRLRAMTAMSPPCSPPTSKLSSPRSPRRLVTRGDNSVYRDNHNVSNGNDVTSTLVNVRKDNLPQSPRVNNSHEHPFPVKTEIKTETETKPQTHKTEIILPQLNKIPDEILSTPKCDKFPVEKSEIKCEKFPTNNNTDTVHIITPSSVQKVPNVTPQTNKQTPQTNKHTNHKPNESIPQFYFPLGQPVLLCDMDTIMKAVDKVFANGEDGKIYKSQMASLSKACNLPLYWKMALFVGAGGPKNGYITLPDFTTICKQVVESCHDNCARFVRLLAKPGCSHLVSDDFVPIVQDIVDGHPGLSFLQEAPEFHTRYINTVIARIFFDVNRSWSGRITVPELRHSNFLETLQLLEEEDDINQIIDFFSYEHFYVIYCKFWELDKDHDLYIDKNDLARHNDHAISSRMIDRIFSGSVTRAESVKEARMSYPDFVWFILSEEDKRHPRSVEYWFRCMDLDGDGVISMYEMEHFYEEQMTKMEALGIERLPFEDALCQMLDLVKPRVPGRVTLSDLKACKLTNIFYDTFFNLDKFLEHEQRDPFANLRDIEADMSEMSDWEKYAAEEYEILVAEEGNGDQEIQYEDDFEADDDEMLKEEMIRLTDAAGSIKPLSKTTDDIYNFDLNEVKY